MTADELIESLKQALPKDRHSEQEFNLIRHNAQKGRKGIELLYGLQDIVFGREANEEFSMVIKEEVSVSESDTEASNLIGAKVTPVLFDGRDLLKRDNEKALEDFDGKIDKLNPDEIAVIAIKIPTIEKEEELRGYFGNRAVILDLNKLGNDTEPYDYFMSIITSPDYRDTLLREGLRLTPDRFKDAGKYLDKA